MSVPLEPLDSDDDHQEPTPPVVFPQDIEPYKPSHDLSDDDLRQRVSPFLETLAFDPDPFQLDAMGVIEEGSSVVVCSPTGSGKTLIAEFAAFKALQRGCKLFYTTPLKALSNQKFSDFQRQYGSDRVGLLTGDLSMNREAQILVMTTEVFRNMLYGLQEDSRLLDDVGYVVLDECHFMNDAERGTVWEESIIYCPETIQMIALSATVANALELTDWINEVHHNTCLVSTSFRPVPLRHFYYNRKTLLPLFKPGTKELNTKLKTEGSSQRRFDKKSRELNSNHLIQCLAERDMLPAIYFTFSRKGCDQRLFDTRSMGLINNLERQRISQIINRYVERYPYLAQNRYLPYLQNGFASHHAGLLPAVKALVEELFQEGLIKAVFATETLAAGINMPARTTVISSLSKRTNDGHRMLNASEFLQMAGRAGRRGMDEVGYVITVASPYEGAYEAAVLASSDPDPLVSQFTPTFGMVLNLLQRYKLEEVEFLISKSFGAFTSDQRIAPLKAALTDYQRKLDEAQEFVCPAELSSKDFNSYLKSKELLRLVNKDLKLYRRQHKSFGTDPELDSVIHQAEGKKTNLMTTIHESPCYDCQVYKKHLHVMERSEKYQKKVDQLSRAYEREKNLYWQSFLNHYYLLKAMEYIDGADQPSAAGKLTADIRAENELYICELILEGCFDGLTPPELAALVCAVTNDSTKLHQFTHLDLSPAVRSRFKLIRPIIKRLEQLQYKHRVEKECRLNPVASALLQAWAEGMTWEALIETTSIDEGDLVRIIRRTADLLRQFSRSEFVPLDLKQRAGDALDMLHRDPITDDNDVLRATMEKQLGLASTATPVQEDKSAESQSES